MVNILIDHRNDVINCSKLKWNHEPQASGFTAKFWTFYGVNSMVYKRAEYGTFTFSFLAKFLGKCYVISMVYTLIDHNSRPISARGGGGRGWRNFWSSRIFFLAILWAGYFFSLFFHKLSITFVLHAVFFLPTSACRIFFFKITHPPFPPQELNGRPLSPNKKTNHPTATEFVLV